MTVSRRERLAGTAVMLVFAGFALWPVVTVLVAAFGPPDAASAVAGDRLWYPENLPNAWSEGRFGLYLSTSAVVAVVVVWTAGVCSILAGYAFATMRFRGERALFYLMLAGLMIPAEAVVVPLYVDLRGLGLSDTVAGVALPQVAQSIAFGTFWMRASFRGAQRELVEAARLDGAGAWRALWSVLVPAGRPAVTTLGVLTFLWTWNEFLIPLVMSPTGQVRTAPLALALFTGQHVQGTALLAAAAVLVALPVVVVYLLAQRHVVRGVVEGAVRG